MGIKNFFKNAFSDMKESAKAEHEVDKAEFRAAKAEVKANFKENRFGIRFVATSFRRCLVSLK